MSKQTIDRITIAYTEQEQSEADMLRKKAGERGINRLIKQILRRWLQEQKA